MIKIFKNNNLHIKFEKEEIEAIKNNKISDIEVLCNIYDFSPIGEEYCVSNFDMAFDVAFNGGWNFYRVLYSNLYDLCIGKMVILKPHTEKYFEEYLQEEWEK